MRVFNPSKWSRIPKGSGLEIAASEILQTRRIRLEVNAPERTKAYFVLEKSEPVFLATFEGLEVIEFTAPPEALRVEFLGNDDVWYFTSDGDQIAVPRPESPSFARVANRRARNPELERMMFMMNQNIERRLSIQREEFAATMQRMEEYRAAQAAEAGADQVTGEILDEQVDDSERAATASADSRASAAGVQPAAESETESGGARKGKAKSVPAGS